MLSLWHGLCSAASMFAGIIVLTICVGIPFKLLEYSSERWQWIERNRVFAAGEKKAALAREFQISRETLYSYLRS